MKRFLYLMLLASPAVFAQSLLNPAPTFSATRQFNAATFATNLSDAMKNDQPLIIYQQQTGLTLLYDGNSDAVGKPIEIPGLRLVNQLNGVKIDSFNPNGATDFGEALASGLINFLINGNTRSSFLLP